MNHNRALKLNLSIHPNSELIGATRKSRFHKINAAYLRIISFCFIPIYNAHSDIIIEYHRSMTAEFSQTMRGLI